MAKKQKLIVPICDFGVLRGHKVVYQSGKEVPIENWHLFKQEATGWIVLRKYYYGYYIEKLIKENETK